MPITEIHLVERTVSWAIETEDEQARRAGAALDTPRTAGRARHYLRHFTALACFVLLLTAEALIEREVISWPASCSRGHIVYVPHVHIQPADPAPSHDTP